MLPPKSSPDGVQPSRSEKSFESSTVGIYHTALESHLASHFSPALSPTESANTVPTNLLMTSVPEVVPSPQAYEAVPTDLLSTRVLEDTPIRQAGAPAAVAYYPQVKENATANLPGQPQLQAAGIPTPAPTAYMPLVSSLPTVLREPYLAEMVSASGYVQPALATSSSTPSSASAGSTAATSSTASTDKCSTSSTFARNYGLVAHLELCLAFAVLVFAGVLILFIFFSAGVWPFKGETTVTPLLETVMDERSLSEPLLAIEASTVTGATGNASTEDTGDYFHGLTALANESLQLYL
ncbi:uncharacterized protein LOC144120076 [Amblyomma americanum]